MRTCAVSAASRPVTPTLEQTVSAEFPKASWRLEELLNVHTAVAEDVLAKERKTLFFSPVTECQRMIMDHAAFENWELYWIFNTSCVCGDSFFFFLLHFLGCDCTRITGGALCPCLFYFGCLNYISLVCLDYLVD